MSPPKKNLSDLRKAAEGQLCQLRFPGVCNFNVETSVLCHYTAPGLGMMGGKPPDETAAVGCSSCHDFMDNRNLPGWEAALRDVMVEDGELEVGILHGIARTHNLWVERGVWKRR